jgi:hypothetical protein
MFGIHRFDEFNDVTVATYNQKSVGLRAQRSIITAHVLLPALYPGTPGRRAFNKPADAKSRG